TALPVSFEPWRWFVSTVDPMLRSLPRDLLLTLLLSRIADYRAAADCLGGFLLTEPARTGPLRYYRAMHAYLVARAEHRPAEQIRTSLEAEFGQVLAARVVRELSEPDGVFDHAAWPACFDCDACPTAPSCRYVAVLRRVKAIQRHQRDHLPNQEALASLFPASAPR
ncbi:MAG: hypothetical protein JXA67_06750, partial [Micromonosporaceae bacterium]|nr:hypothetical protein [Micromonosporaceae bacterium]